MWLPTNGRGDVLKCSYQVVMLPRVTAGAAPATDPLDMTTDAENELLALLRRLPQAQVQQLLDYAQYLLERHGQPEEVASLAVIARPSQETVLQAIKRLSASYPMLDRGLLLTETSALMTQHVLQGKDAVEVIDALEVVFQRHYQKHLESTATSGS